MGHSPNNTSLLLYPPLQRSWNWYHWYTGITLSVCPSVVERGVYWYHLVRLSVCGQNRVSSVSSIILIGSISYLHILSSNFRRCVTCNSRFKILKFWRIFKICNFDFVFIWLGIQYDSMVWVIIRQRGVSSERRCSSCSSCHCYSPPLWNQTMTWTNDHFLLRYLKSSQGWLFAVRNLDPVSKWNHFFFHAWGFSL